MKTELVLLHFTRDAEVKVFAKLVGIELPNSFFFFLN